eukprot:NODE_749_length_4226_cov_0.916404.p4 type:complete len:134 gc:universal NODE_749_length_4226_cov_0.916404:3221-2820(-)
MMLITHLFAIFQITVNCDKNGLPFKEIQLKLGEHEILQSTINGITHFAELRYSKHQFTLKTYKTTPLLNNMIIRRTRCAPELINMIYLDQTSKVYNLEQDGWNCKIKWPMPDIPQTFSILPGFIEIALKDPTE